MTTTRGLRIGETVLGGAVLALGLFVLIETFFLKTAPGTAAVGPKLFPFLIAGGLLLVGGLLLREAFAGRVAHGQEAGFELDWPAVAIVSAGLVAQLLLVEWIGWIPAAALPFAAAAYAFGERRLWLALVIGLGLAALTFVLFDYGLDLSLPLGSIVEDWQDSSG